MPALTIGFAESKNNFSRIAAEINRTGRPVTILKNNKPLVVVQPAWSAVDALGVAVDSVDEYADVFEELAK